MNLDLNFLDRKRSGLKVKASDKWHKTSVVQSFGLKANLHSSSNQKTESKRGRGNNGVERLVQDAKMAQAYQLAH